MRVEVVEIPPSSILRAANKIKDHLGPKGIEKIGGLEWWQWRLDGSILNAEWIERKSDHAKRIQTGDGGKRVILYVHGGAYFFGSVDEHRYQMQRYARKLEARVFARYVVLCVSAQ